MENNLRLTSFLQSSATFRSHLQSVNSTSSFTNLFGITAERCAAELTQFVLRDDYVEGDVSKTQLYLEKLYLDKGVRIFREAFQKCWVRLFALDNPKHLYTFACIASCLPYEWLDTHGITLILGCAAHKHYLVNEACIRMAEAWETSEHAKHLENMTPFDIDWLEEYRLETIEFLKELP
ncbi:hypothetical protein [Vibrio parahaemolyticus]|uniref:hypothetical protein n=1 Tax=Vibrio parahaemolyticus TaxID=670 RepID=UPI00111FF22B|nr:hypothetical protein [Vibrio parahaemolyticus]HCE2193706.1 hypothetical protein [Vibrio parahaemolyticus]HCG7317551.1 hypothetical protein [Vibrio parahaemolyticus]